MNHACQRKAVFKFQMLKQFRNNQYNYSKVVKIIFRRLRNTKVINTLYFDDVKKRILKVSNSRFSNNVMQTQILS